MAENIELEPGKLYQYFDQKWRLDRIEERKAIVSQYHGRDQFSGREIFGDAHTWHVDDLKLLRPIAGK